MIIFSRLSDVCVCMIDCEFKKFTIVRRLSWLKDLHTLCRYLITISLIVFKCNELNKLNTIIIKIKLR